MKYGIRTVSAMGVFMLSASAALAQSAEEAAPCLADANGKGCQSCLQEAAGDRTLLGLICYGGEEPPTLANVETASTLPLSAVRDVCSMNVCSNDPDVYRQCIGIADAYMESALFEQLMARKNELSDRRLGYEEVCAPDALPALLIEAERQLVIYNVFNIETRTVWDSCITQMNEEFGAIVDDANLGNNSKGSGTLRVNHAEWVLDQIPWIKGSFAVRQTFGVGENLENLTEVIRRNASDCEAQ